MSTNSRPSAICSGVGAVIVNNLLCRGVPTDKPRTVPGRKNRLTIPKRSWRGHLARLYVTNRSVHPTSLYIGRFLDVPYRWIIPTRDRIDQPARGQRHGLGLGHLNGLE